jgi:hypothetical protein
MSKLTPPASVTGIWANHLIGALHVGPGHLDYSYSGPQGAAVARALNSGKIQLGAIHTYIELFARYFVDLTPHVALTVARSADRGRRRPLGCSERLPVISAVET